MTLNLSTGEIASAVFAVLVAAAGATWGTLKAFVKWALPRALDERIDARLAGKASQADLDALARRVDEGHEELLGELKENTGRIARSIEKLTDAVVEQGKEISELRGAWNGVQRRRGDE